MTALSVAHLSVAPPFRTMPNRDFVRFSLAQRSHPAPERFSAAKSDCCLFFEIYSNYRRQLMLRVCAVERLGGSALFLSDITSERNTAFCLILSRSGIPSCISIGVLQLRMKRDRAPKNSSPQADALSRGHRPVTSEAMKRGTIPPTAWWGQPARLLPINLAHRRLSCADPHFRAASSACLLSKRRRSLKTSKPSRWFRSFSGLRLQRRTEIVAAFQFPFQCFSFWTFEPDTSLTAVTMDWIPQASAFSTEPILCCKIAIVADLPSTTPPRRLLQKTHDLVQSRIFGALRGRCSSESGSNPTTSRREELLRGWVHRREGNMPLIHAVLCEQRILRFDLLELAGMAACYSAYASETRFRERLPFFFAVQKSCFPRGRIEFYGCPGTANQS